MTTQHDQDKAAFEEWAISHGRLFLHPADNEDISLPLWPRTYANYTTEIAWRAWANKPVSQLHAQALKDAEHAEREHQYWLGAAAAYAQELSGYPACRPVPMINGVELAMLYREVEDNNYKVSKATTLDLISFARKSMEAKPSPEDEEALKDAERYRWLREHHQDIYGDDLEVAIDAAMQADKAKEGGHV